MNKFNTFWRRFWASILDSIISSLIGLGISYAFISLSSGGFSRIGTVLSGLLTIGYYVLLHFYFGQTIGKMAASVKVLDNSETSINFGQSILRSLPQVILVMFSISFMNVNKISNNSVEAISAWLSVLIFIFNLADIIVFLSNEKRRALHDYIAGTVVVRTDI